MWFNCLSYLVLCNSYRMRCTPRKSSLAWSLQDKQSLDGEVRGVPQSPSAQLMNTLPKFTSLCLAFVPLLSPKVSRAVDSYGYTAPEPRLAVLPLVYSVEMSFSPPYLQPRTRQGEDGALRRIGKRGNILLMGMHTDKSNSKDVDLALDLTERMIRVLERQNIFSTGISKVKSILPTEGFGGVNSNSFFGSDRADVVLALACVERTDSTEMALDAYFQQQHEGSDGTIRDMGNAVSGECRDREAQVVRGVLGAGHDPTGSAACSCGGQCTSLLNVLRWAKQRHVRVELVGITQQVKKAVAERGLVALTDTQKASLISDVPGFIGAKEHPGFARYAEKVLLPADADNSGGEAELSTYSAENHFAARMLEQEAVASAVAQLSVRAEEESPGSPLVVVLLDAADAVFGYGVQERVERNLRLTAASTGASVSSSVSAPEVYSVLLNPTARDSLSDTVQLRLCLAYGPYLKDQRPLADFLWYSDSPPARLLPRVKNAISREGDKPSGESSILAAF